MSDYKIIICIPRLLQEKQTLTKANFFITLLSSILLFVLAYKKTRERKRKKITSSLKRFKDSFKGKKYLQLKLAENNSNVLMANPEENIKIGKWDKESDLVEKADIHRTRLIKFGRSKLNGEMLFMNKESKVYRITKAGKKQFL